MQTKYQVTHKGKAICTGNLKQCLLYLMNTIPLDRTVKEVMLDEICIEPIEREAPCHLVK